MTLVHIVSTAERLNPIAELSATRITLRGKAKVHKSADSGGSVVHCARRCSQVRGIPTKVVGPLVGTVGVDRCAAIGSDVYWDHVPVVIWLIEMFRSP